MNHHAVVCGAELEPTVRQPRTVRVNALHRIGGRAYCRQHIIAAAVAAGVIAEVKPGAGPVAMAHRGAPSAEYDQYRQR